jgi:hypothetical protein
MSVQVVLDTVRSVPGGALVTLDGVHSVPGGCIDRT